ncbi:MAG: hypothetical protein KC983_05670 [Phycisphaerales bacterium]|nr:hypothetical protein [Phycisphaerales bacterium]
MKRGETNRLFACSVILAGLALVAVVFALATMTITRDASAAAGAANLLELRNYWIASAVAWVMLTLVIVQLRRQPRRETAPPRPDRSRSIALTILIIAAGARLAVVITHRPALSDDMYRYMYDGENLAHGINPYLAIPNESARAFDPTALRNVTAERWPGERELARRTNNPELSTIYLPTSQWTFGGIAMLTRDAAWNLVREERLYRAAFVVIDLIIIGFIITLLHRRGRSLWWAIAYAWHPLPIAEVAGSGHQDVIGIALVVLALLMWHESAQRVARWTIPLALASLVKPVVLPVTLVFLRGHTWRQWALSIITGAVICTAIAAPLWFTSGGAPLRALGETSTRFSLKWAHFGSVYEPTLWMIERATNTPDEYWTADDRTSMWTNDEQERLARMICLGLIALVVVTVMRSRLDVEAGARVILLAMVLFSSTAHPWYLLWALALSPLAMSPAVWIASLTISWGYAQLGDVIDWTTPAWVLWIAYVPVYAALAWDLLPRVRRAGPNPANPADTGETTP